MPAAAYDWPTHKRPRSGVIGHDFADYYGWHYPPTFLFVAAALATLPFLAAAVVSLLATLAAYVAAMARHSADAPEFLSRWVFPPRCGT